MSNGSVFVEPSSRTIANVVLPSSPTLSRVLSELQKRGFVEMRGREILLSRKFAGDAIADAMN